MPQAGEGGAGLEGEGWPRRCGAARGPVGVGTARLGLARAGSVTRSTRHVTARLGLPMACRCGAVRCGVAWWEAGGGLLAALPAC